MCTLNRIVLVTAVAIAAGLVSAAPAPADVLILKNGREIEGELIQQTKYTVTFESKGTRYYFKMAEVEEVRTDDESKPVAAPPAPAPAEPAPVPAPAPGHAEPAAVVPAQTPPAAVKPAEPFKVVRPSGPSYFVIPLEGQVGLEMTTELLEKSLKYAEEIKPEVIILEINSPGGYVAEMVPIMDMLVRWQGKHKTRMVALVREQALSAAAIIAMACKEIYMMPGTTIGAAMIINVQGDRIARVEEKFESAIRAKARTVAEFGGHSSAIVEAMIDPAVELWLEEPAEAGGKPRVVRGPVKPEDAEARKLKLVDAKEKLLTLTPDEAIRIGLVTATVGDVAALLEHMGLAELEDAGDYARQVREAHQAEVDNITREFENLTAAIRKRQASNVLGGTLDDLYRQRNELRRIKLTIDKIEKLAAPHSMMSRFIEGAYGETFESIRFAVDQQMSWCEDGIRELQYRARMR